MKDDEFMKLLGESTSNPTAAKKKQAKPSEAPEVTSKDQSPIPPDDSSADSSFSSNSTGNEQDSLFDLSSLNISDIKSRFDSPIEEANSLDAQPTNKEALEAPDSPTTNLSEPLDVFSHGSANPASTSADASPFNFDHTNPDLHLAAAVNATAQAAPNSPDSQEAEQPSTNYFPTEPTIPQPVDATDNNNLDPAVFLKATKKAEDAATKEGSSSFSAIGAFSAVAQSSSTKRLIVIFIGLLAVFASYWLFHTINYNPNREKEEKAKAIEANKQQLLETAKTVTAPIQTNQDTVAVEAPKPPVPMPLAPPAPPPPPTPPTPVAPPPPALPVIDTAGPTLPTLPSFAAPKAEDRITNRVTSFFNKDDEQEKAKLLARRKSSSIVVGGGGAANNTTNGTNTASTSPANKSSFLGFSNGAMAAKGIGFTSSSQVQATYIGKLDTIIAQGKMINAVLETAINTDLPGNLRAVVTRDVYAESGKNILIPKGSRVIGAYQSQLSAGQVRVAVMWNRLIRPDGVDIQMGFQGTDELGRAGVPGYLDNKFWLQMGLAALTSYIIPVVANKVAGVNDNVSTNSTTQSPDGSTTTSSTGSTGSAQMQQSAQNFQQITQSVVQNSFNTNPTITIDQGERVNIFVNKDLVFSDDIVSDSMQVLR